MNRFFHYWLTCPSCHAPHVDTTINRPILVENGFAQCRNPDCRARFPLRITFPSARIYPIPKTFHTNGVPLYWEIQPNPIEQSYIHWLKNGLYHKGLILITWPFPSVKCIPLLIHILMQNTSISSPILVFSKHIQEGSPLQGMKSPSSNILTKCLLSYNDEINRHTGTHYFDSAKLQNVQKKLFEKISKIIKSRHVSLTYFKIHGIKYEFFKKLSDEELPEDVDKGSVLRHRVMTRPKLRYNKEWLDFVLRNYNQLYRVSFNDIIEIFEPADYPDDMIKGEKVVFIRTRSDTFPTPELLQRHVDIPSFVFIEDLEYFLHIHRRQEFFSFLNMIKDKSTILLFSNNPRLRYLHLDLRDEFGDDIDFHCWDTKNRLQWLQSNVWKDNKESCFCNPACSKIFELQGED